MPEDKARSCHGAWLEPERGRGLLAVGVGPALAALLLVLLAGPSEAIEATLSLTASSPRETWSVGWSGDVSLTFLKLGVFGAELARQSSTPYGQSLTYVTAHALLALPAGKFRLYGGVGSGLFQRRALTNAGDDFGALSALIFGAKTRLSDLVVIKVEYRRLALTGGSPASLRHRISIGAGLAL
jgi:hypothetical protein